MFDFRVCSVVVINLHAFDFRPEMRMVKMRTVQMMISMRTTTALMSSTMVQFSAHNLRKADKCIHSMIIENTRRVRFV